MRCLVQDRIRESDIRADSEDHLAYAWRTSQAQAFQKCLAQPSVEHILHLEEDVVAKPTWLQKLNREVLPALSHYDRNWLAACLFLSDDLRGWTATELARIGSGLGLACLVVILLLRRARLGLLPSLTLLLLLYPFIALFLLQGRQAALPIPPGLHEIPDACCAQSLIFSRQCATELLVPGSDFAQDEIHLRDLAPRSYAARHHLDTPVRQQSLWQHIGTMSGTRRQRLDHFVRNWGSEVEGKEW